MADAFPIVSMPKSGEFVHKTAGCLQQWALAHLLEESEEDTCEDPLIDTKYLELARMRWRSLTPGRFKNEAKNTQALSAPDDGIESATLLHYETYL